MAWLPEPESLWEPELQRGVAWLWEPELQRGVAWLWEPELQRGVVGAVGTAVAVGAGWLPWLASTVAATASSIDLTASTVAATAASTSAVTSVPPEHADGKNARASTPAKPKRNPDRSRQRLFTTQFKHRGPQTAPRTSASTVVRGL